MRGEKATAPVRVRDIHLNPNRQTSRDLLRCTILRTQNLRRSILCIQNLRYTCATRTSRRVTIFYSVIIFSYHFLTEGLNDAPVTVDGGGDRVDWARSFHGLSAQPFDKDVADILLKPITAEEVEVKADGIVYLPEIKYRRILNRAFGPGGWGLAPRSETIVTDKAVTREYALVAHGRYADVLRLPPVRGLGVVRALVDSSANEFLSSSSLVSVARGEQDYFSPEGIPTATEGCKSNAMMRCCKDLGIASELWDPQFIRKFMVDHAKEIFVEHAVTKRRRKIWMRKDDQPKYPYKEAKSFGT
ncbi:MAG: hypothetical protein M1826_006106 [Phylliscum demangeonii]|nr:MAG: hypothetical protein M1826_006106 [Phylliscum demangeonii]